MRLFSLNLHFHVNPLVRRRRAPARRRRRRGVATFARALRGDERLRGAVTETQPPGSQVCSQLIVY